MFSNMAENTLNTFKIQQKTRNYRCPCGKSYLSYPALFTHIKQKHNGKAPGQVQKPKRSNRLDYALSQIQNSVLVMDAQIQFKHKNGYSKKEERESNKRSSSYTTQQISEEGILNEEHLAEFKKLFVLLEEAKIYHNFAIEFLVQLQAYKQLEHFVYNYKPQHKRQSGNKYPLGLCLSQFIKTVSFQTTSQQFGQVLLLFTGLLDYVFFENVVSLPCKVLRQYPIDSLAQLISQFVDYHAEAFKARHGLDDIWIFDRAIMQRVFLSFWSWLKWKQYAAHGIFFTK